MKFRRRRSLFSARRRRDLEQSEPLKGQLWTRSEQSLREPGVHWAWRGSAAVAAIAECALLGWLWFGPALSVQTVAVEGTQHMTSSQVARAAGLGGGTSVLSVDGVSARQHLLSQIWVRAATVDPQLPGTVVIRVSEWQPIAGYHAGKTGKLFFMSDQAVVLGPTTAEGTLVAKRGWKVYFGRVLTPEEFATLRDKLTALKAINGQVNYNSADLEYVNVMNPSEAAVGYKSREPAPPSPTAGATPAPTPAAACK